MKDNTKQTDITANYVADRFNEMISNKPDDIEVGPLIGAILAYAVDLSISFTNIEFIERVVKIQIDQTKKDGGKPQFTKLYSIN